MSLQSELADLYERGEGRKEFFQMLAGYTNRRSEILADSAANSSKLAISTVVVILKELADIDIGEFKVGRRGAKTRLILNFSPRSVGEVAIGTATALDAYHEANSQENAGSDSPAQASKTTLTLDINTIIERAKRDLANKLGLSPEKIRINIDF